MHNIANFNICGAHDSRSNLSSAILEPNALKCCYPKIILVCYCVYTSIHAITLYKQWERVKTTENIAFSQF